MDFVKYEIDGPVATLTVDHPPANALSNQVLAEIEDSLTRAEADTAVRALIFTGAGEKFFIAGADITEFLTIPKEHYAERTAKGQKVTLQMETMGTPVIMAVNGYCLGGGCEMAMAGDVRIAAENAVFGQPEIKLGIIPGFGGTQRFVRLMGKSRAMELLFTGDNIDAATALELGLVSRVVPQAELMPAARELALRLAAMAPLAIAAIKRAVHDGVDRPMEEALEAERKEFAAIRFTHDAIEGITAFLEKRPPAFTGDPTEVSQ
ncbi:MAG TPA: enoyl-CoA hydratase-related protein [Candidatus Solibacter sp.]|nr:enoyl-CoA hydratase-related protein [Candidatus Solibacter sp.]